MACEIDASKGAALSCPSNELKPILFMSRAGGDWQMYCHDSNHDFEDEEALREDMRLVHIAHLVARDPTLNQIADLPEDMGAERTEVGGQWTRFEDEDSN